MIFDLTVSHLTEYIVVIAVYCIHCSSTMLKSTYTPPPPLPPGWSEHKAPSGPVCTSPFSSTLAKYGEQAISTTIIQSRSSRHTLGHRHKLLNRLQGPQTRPTPPSISRRRLYHLFLLLLMDPQAMTPELRNMFPRNMVVGEEDFAVEGATMIAGVESVKTGRGRNILYQTPHHGCW